jgi:hypothetical protein
LAEPYRQDDAAPHEHAERYFSRRLVHDLKKRRKDDDEEKHIEDGKNQRV